MKSIASITFVLYLVYTAVVKAAGDYGPDTCLEPWVWRDAWQGDHVCVPAATRDQNAADNAIAYSRTGANGTCLPGFVWRQANASDHVCVTPERQTQTAFDNSQAANRVAALHIWLTHDYPIAGSPGLITINGDHFNLASVTIDIYRTSDDSVMFSKIFTPGYSPGYIAGSFGVPTDIVDCEAVSDLGYDSWVQVFDSVSTRISNKIYLKTIC